VKQWVLPPGTSAAFVAAMERVLALYAEPYDPARPVVCFDERPCVLHADVREPLPVRPGREARRDHEYVREGSCCVLMAFEPLRPTESGPSGNGRGWRRAWTRPQRRRVDFAACVRELCEEVYPEAETVRLVCDNLNTHSAASFYEAFAPAEARRLAERVEFVYTPVHGSWLNVVEIEFSVLARQCLRRRIGTLAETAAEVLAWIELRNAEGTTVGWQFTTEDARVTLSRLYPTG
jgi:hypothetical protein